jgi:hypothetical protein
MVAIERTYAPGVCNISKEEEARRLASGWIGIVVTIVLAAALWFLAAPALWRLTLFFPAALAASGFLQASMHFCAGYGMKGVFNVGAEVGKTQTVEQAEFAAKDRAKARQILGLALAVGVGVAVLALILP